MTSSASSLAVSSALKSSPRSTPSRDSPFDSGTYEFYNSFSKNEFPNQIWSCGPPRWRSIIINVTYSFVAGGRDSPSGSDGLQSGLTASTSPQSSLSAAAAYNPIWSPAR